ncbi:M14 family metallopeptidase (plasmid) [Haloferacaceae archaeon DSL9]
MSNRSKRAALDDTVDRTEAIDSGRFDDCSIDRRTFLSLSAATGAALALPGTVAASERVTDDRLTAEYEFVINHARADYEAPTVIEFTDADAVDAFADVYEEEGDDDVPYPAKAVTRGSPTPAGHAHLTADEVRSVLEMDGIESMDFSPGANPFWKLDDPYADGVFPAVEDARNYISHGETGQALRHLEAERPDRIRASTIGRGPGWENRFTGEDPDPQDIYLVEVTENVRDDDSFDAKKKVIYSIGIHGDERTGVEVGCRLIEELAAGAADDFEGLLDDVVLIFAFTNPDGWVSRKPQQHIPWVPEGITNFQRGNAAGVDTNRQYPTIGWTDPSFWPAEPDGAPDEYRDVVPDALSIVEHFRGYENVEYLCDYHGMYTANSAVFNLETNAPFDHNGTHDLDEVNIRIGAGMDDEWGSVDPIRGDISRAANEMYGLSDYAPDSLFDYGTIYDSLNYQVTGAFLGWAGQPEEFGGLGAITVAPEIILANHFTSAEKSWKPYIARHQVTAYRISMREYAAMAAAATNATVATGGQDTAYVVTDELTRSSSDLSHTDDGRPGDPPDHANPPGQRAAEVRRTHGVVKPGPSGRSAIGPTATEASHSLSMQFDGVGDATGGTIRVKNPAGRVVHEIDLAAKANADAPGARKHDFEGWFVRRPAAGRWTVEVDSDVEIEVSTAVLDSDEEHPDPEEILGYEQREYTVNPMQFFADLAEYLEDGEMAGVRVHDVRIGRLLRGNSGKRRYDKLVVSHDVGIDDARYRAEIERFVDAGGDLVLTDTGVNLLGALDVGDAASIEAGDVETIDVNFANLDNRDFDSPLLAGIRPLQQEMWKGSQLGYTTGVDQPATVVDPDAFDAAGGRAAGTMGPDAGVAVGTVTAGDSEIAVLGSILPPAQQTELHPFGMADYSVSFMGHTLVCNALGFEQRRYYEGELIRTYGSVR